MSTRYQLEQQIIDDIDRTDINTQVARSVETAIRMHEHDRYWFNQVYQSSVTLSSSMAFIPLASLPYRFLEFDRVRLIRDANYYSDLLVRDRDWLMSRQDIIVYTEPYEYAVYGEKLQFDSYADRDYELRIDGLVSLGNTASNTFSISSSVAWFGDARDMIRAAAKKDLFLHVIKDPEQAVAMGVIEKGIKDTLKAKTNQRASTGRIRPDEW